MNKWKIKITADDLDCVKNFEYDLLDNDIQVNISTTPVQEGDRFTLNLFGEKADFRKLSKFFPHNSDIELYTMDIWNDNITYYQIHNKEISSHWKENIASLQSSEAIEKFDNYGFSA